MKNSEEELISFHFFIMQKNVINRANEVIIFYLKNKLIVENTFFDSKGSLLKDFVLIILRRIILKLRSEGFISD